MTDLSFEEMLSAVHNPTHYWQEVVAQEVRQIPLGYGQHEAPVHFFREMLDHLNWLRGEHGIGPLMHNTSLATAARAHSVHMAYVRHLTHEGWEWRIRERDYRAHFISQNIAQCTNGAWQAVSLFMSSDVHRANILDMRMCCAGFSCVIDEHETQWWTQNFSS